MKIEVWDERKCLVGEGPIATGTNHNHILWVDILGQKLLWRNLLTEELGSWEIGEDISFVVPRIRGGMVVGTASGPVIFYEDGRRATLPTRFDADGFEDPIPIRWNDAKVAPNGDLWLGSMAYGGRDQVAGLYRLETDEKKMTRVIDKVQVGNGLAWSPNSKTFYFIDSPTKGIDAFDFENGAISNRRQVWSASVDSEEVPDGMTVDSEGGLWVAFWGGSRVRRFDSKFQVSEEIIFPNKYITSCAFAGSDLKTLVITTAQGETGFLDPNPVAGMTFLAYPGVAGIAPTPFGRQVRGVI